jgi:hypothetical protein
VPADRLYDATMYVLAAFLVAGFICNALIRPVNQKWMMKDEEVARLQNISALPSGPIGSHGIGLGGLDPKAVLAWLAVGVPLAWGVWKTLESALKIFG